jgi:DNA polymerase III epsilon subunit-like protein
MQTIDRLLHSVVVLDTETTNLLPDQAEIVEIAGCVWDGAWWRTDGMLLNARNGIPPEASAKNNISRRMIQSEPYFDQAVNDIKHLLRWNTASYFVAHNAAYDRQVLSHAWHRMDSIADARVCDDQSRWICTWRLSKHVLGHQFPDIEYGLNYLRYLLDLDVPDSHGVHRAGDDAMTCALLLQALIDFAIEQGQVTDDDTLGAQLNTLCWSPINIVKWPYGRYRGTLLADIPNDYYAWALKNLAALRPDDPGYYADLAESVRQLLERRLEEADEA